MSELTADLSGAKRCIIERLKRADTSTAPELALEFGLTDTAIRQHLEALEIAELVERSVAPAAGRGRPPVHWRLTANAAPLFADRHADLTVDLIESIRSALGEDALDKVVRARAERQLANYRMALAGTDDPTERVHRLPAAHRVLHRQAGQPDRPAQAHRLHRVGDHRRDLRAGAGR